MQLHPWNCGWHGTDLTTVYHIKIQTRQSQNNRFQFFFDKIKFLDSSPHDAYVMSANRLMVNGRVDALTRKGIDKVSNVGCIHCLVLFCFVCIGYNAYTPALFFVSSVGLYLVWTLLPINRILLLPIQKCKITMVNEKLKKEKNHLPNQEYQAVCNN